jgi:hypothetical protein
MIQNMKKTIIALALLTTLQAGFAQERLSSQEALDYAAIVGADVKQLQGTPIPSHVDLKQPVVLRDGEFGGMVLPEATLSLESLAKAGDSITPVGQLWLLRLAPMSDGVAISGDKLRLATVEHDGETYRVPQCALAVRRTASGGMELLVFGKDKEPLLKVALKQVVAKQDVPLDMAADRESDSAEITLKILGKYEAKFKVTQSDL